MSDLLWVIFLFVALTLGFFTGFAAGLWRAGDDCPSENAYINVTNYAADAQKEVEKYKAELNCQRFMEVLKLEHKENQNRPGNHC